MTTDDTSSEKKLEDLFELIDEIGTCMLTTRRDDGHLVSRAMQVQLRTDDGRLWFVTDESAHKLDELERDPHVNCAFYKDASREWVSVSGIAKPARDRELIHRMYKPDWKAWFPEQGDERHGGPDDPRMALIGVEAHTVTYFKSDRPKPLALFELVKGIATGTTPKLGDLRHVDERDLDDVRPGA